MCWAGSMTFAVSRDGGYDFMPASPFVIAAPLQPFSVNFKRVGPFAQTNIVRNPRDNNYYVLTSETATYRTDTSDRVAHLQEQGVCIARSTDLRHWQFWNGHAFAVDVGSPYQPVAPAAQRVCTTILGPGTVLRSVVFHEPTKIFIAVGKQKRQAFYIWSSDLIHWTAPAWLDNTDGDLSAAAYLSMLDPASDSRSFDTVGAAPFMYIIKGHRSAAGRPAIGERDVLRAPLTIHWQPKPM